MVEERANKTMTMAMTEVVDEEMMDKNSEETETAMGKVITNPVVRICENIKCLRLGREFIIDGDNRRELSKKYCSDDCRDAVSQRNRRARLKAKSGITTAAPSASAVASNDATTDYAQSTDDTHNDPMTNFTSSNYATDNDATYDNADFVKQTFHQNDDTDAEYVHQFNDANAVLIANEAANDAMTMYPQTSTIEAMTYLAERNQLMTNLLSQLLEERCAAANSNLMQIETYLLSLQKAFAIPSNSGGIFNNSIASGDNNSGTTISQNEAELLCALIAEQVGVIQTLTDSKLFDLTNFKIQQEQAQLEQMSTVALETLAHYRSVVVKMKEF